MMTCKYTDDGIIIDQNHLCPRVYLDYCALRLFSDSSSRDGRLFLENLKNKKGTLYLSWMLVLESFGHGPGKSYKKLLGYLDNVDNYWGLLDCEYNKVIKKETEWVSGMQNPSIDDDFLRNVFMQWHKHRGVIGKIKTFIKRRYYPDRNEDDFTPKDMFSELERYPEEAETYRKLASDTKKRLADIIRNGRNTVRRYPKARNNVTTMKPQYVAGTLPTRYIYKSIFRELMLGTDNFQDNDSADLMHAITSTAYSDFVVLDNKWARRINGISLPSGTAKVYGISQINKFLQDFCST